MVEKEELSNEELEKVSGGTTHSSDTYDELGVPYDHARQSGSNHPVITTYFNNCNFSQHNCCDCSEYHSFTFLSGYCGARSEEYDPTK